MRADLHSHTLCSDGELSPEALVRRAAGAGVTHLAITDHDGVAGVDEASRAGAVMGVEIVAGIEVTAQLHGRECHVLGHFLDLTRPGLAAWCVARKDERQDRLRAMAAKLTAGGVHIDFDALVREAGDATLGRPHLARALVSGGYAHSVADAFSRFLGVGGPGYVDRPRPEATEVIALLREAGGTSSLAHPGLNKVSRAELRQLADAGLDAVEADHPDHPPSQAGDIARWAKDVGIQVTGGSDFHGARTGSVELGARTTRPEAFAVLRERALGRRRTDTRS
jgi:predicted metal-dependent phosphoesterase TrpH